MDGELTHEQLMSDLIAAHRVQRPPEGAVTAQQFADETGLSVSRSRDILREKVAAGEMECGEFQNAEKGRGRPFYYWFSRGDEDIP